MTLPEIAQIYSDLVQLEKEIPEEEYQAKARANALRSKYHDLLMTVMRQEGRDFSDRFDVTNRAVSPGKSIKITEECVRRDIFDANIYHSLMFKWINSLVAVKGFEKAFDGMFHWVRDALETKYIFALAKLFARSNEAGLWCFIQQAREYPQEVIDLKLERANSFLKEDLKSKREAFLKNFDPYEKKISEINSIIEPFRNIQRAHNLPWRQDKGKGVTWDNTKEWLNFAEHVFVEVMDGIVEPVCRVGDFFPAELTSQMDYFVATLKDPIEKNENQRVNRIAEPQ